MSKLINLQDQAVTALIQVNRPGVISTLKEHNIPFVDEPLKLHDIVLSALANNAAFTKDFIALMASESDSKLSADGMAGDIISAAMQGLGQITGTWQNVANQRNQTMLAQTQMLAKQQEDANKKKLSQGAIIGIVFGSIFLIGAITFGIVIAAKRK